MSHAPLGPGERNKLYALAQELIAFVEDADARAADEPAADLIEWSLRHPRLRVLVTGGDAGPSVEIEDQKSGLKFTWRHSGDAPKTWGQVVESALVELMLLDRSSAAAVPPPPRKVKPRTARFEADETKADAGPEKPAAEEAKPAQQEAQGVPKEPAAVEAAPTTDAEETAAGDEPPWMKDKADEDLVRKGATLVAPDEADRSAERDAQQKKSQMPGHVSELIQEIQDVEREQTLPIHDAEWKGALYVDGERRGAVSGTEEKAETAEKAGAKAGTKAVKKDEPSDKEDQKA